MTPLQKILAAYRSTSQAEREKGNLGKELPRIPAVKSYADFRAFVRSGRELAHWHLNYETVDCFPGAEVEETLSTSFDCHANGPYRVKKMKFAKTKDPGMKKSADDKATVIYSDYITIRNIPLELFLRVIPVSLETMKVVGRLPKLEEKTSK